MQNSNLDNIQAVLVLYKCKLEESETYISISQALKANNQHLDLYVYDNSPDYYYNADIVKDYPGNITYVHDASNPGICKPYNNGLEIAIQSSKKWLLLLDQDTGITINYFITLYEAIKINNIASIVPIVYSNDEIVSPTRYDLMGRMKPVSSEEFGSVTKGITAINSGACILVDFLSEINGFNEVFPLDMLDHWFYSEVVKHKRDIFLLDTELQHNLSVSNYRILSIERYKKIIDAEILFYKLYTTPLIRSFLNLRLLIRALKFIIYLKFNFMSVTIKSLFISVKK